MTDKISDRTDVILQLLGERQCSPHQPRDTLAQRIVEPFDVIGQPRFLHDRFGV
jgi:hypothetical protein